jgi:hypothetical protein
MSLADVCRSNLVFRRTDKTLVVRPYARRVSLRVDADVQRIVLETTPSDPPVQVRVACGTQFALGMSGGTFVLPGPFVSPVAIEIVSTAAESADAIPPPSPRVWPVLRRAMTESRDRIVPLPRRLGGRRGGR